MKLKLIPTVCLIFLLIIQIPVAYPQQRTNVVVDSCGDKSLRVDDAAYTYVDKTGKLCTSGTSGSGGAGDASAANQVTQTGILTTIDADTGNIASSVASLDAKATTSNTNTGTIATNTGTAATNTGTIAGAVTSNRMAVNPIVGQSGIAAGTGVDGATVPRFSLATNVPLPAGTNVIGHAIIDSGSTTAVTQATGTNLHTVVDSGTITAVTSITNALPSGTNVIGHVIADSGSTTAVTQATGTNLHTVVDSGTITTVSAVTAISNALPAGTNVIGHVIADSGSTTAATQATASNLNAQVVGAVASAGSNTGNPLKIGGAFNTTQPTVTTGQIVDAQMTARGAQIVATGADTFNVGTVTAVTAISNALPAGTNVIGHVIADSGSTTAVTQATGTNLHTVVDSGTITTVSAVTAITNALPAGTNAIGKLAANSGVDIGDVDVTSIVPGTGATNLGKAEDSVAASGDTGVAMLGVIQATLTAPAADGDYTVPKLNANGAAWVQSVFIDAAEGAAVATNPVPVGCVYRSSPGTLDTGDVGYPLCNTDGRFSIDVAKINNVTPLMGNGVTGTGSQRVTIASDNTPFHVIIDSGSTTAITTPSTIGVYVEDAGETAGGNLMMSGSVRRDVAASSAGTTGDNATLNTDALGLLWTREKDPCSGVAKSFYVIDLATSGTVEIANAVANEFWYICSVEVVTAAANNVVIADDDTDGCGSLTEGITGGNTSAKGWNFAANGGIAHGNGSSSIAKAPTANRYLCLAISASTQTSGVISYVSAP